MLLLQFKVLKIESLARVRGERMIPINRIWQQNSGDGIRTGCSHDVTSVRLQEKRSLVTMRTTTLKESTYIVDDVGTKYDKFYINGMDRSPELSEHYNGTVMVHDPPLKDAGSPSFTERYVVDSSKTLYHIWSLEQLTPSMLRPLSAGVQFQMDTFHHSHSDADQPRRSSHSTQYAHISPHPLTDSGVSSSRYDPHHARISCMDDGRIAPSAQGAEELFVVDTPSVSSSRSEEPPSRDHPIVSSPIQGIRVGEQSQEKSAKELSLNSRHNASSSHPSVSHETVSVSSDQTETEDDIYASFLATKCFERELLDALQEASAGILQGELTTEKFSKSVLRHINVQHILDDKDSHLVIKLDELMPLLQAALAAKSPNSSHAQAINLRMNPPLARLKSLGYSKATRKLEAFAIKSTAISSSHPGICLEDCLETFLHLPGSMEYFFRMIARLHGTAPLVCSLKVILDECGAETFWEVYGKVGEANLDGTGPQMNLDAEPESVPVPKRAAKAAAWLESQRDGQESVASFCMDDMAQTAPIRQSRFNSISENSGFASGITPSMGCAGLSTAELQISLQAGQNFPHSNLSSSSRRKNTEETLSRHSRGVENGLQRVITSLNSSDGRGDIASTIDSLSNALSTGQLPLTVDNAPTRGGGLAGLIKEQNAPISQKRVEFTDPPTTPRGGSGLGVQNSMGSGNPTSYARLLQSLEQKRNR